MGGGVQQSLHSQTRRVRGRHGHSSLSHTSLRPSLQPAQGVSDKFCPRPVDGHESGLLNFPSGLCRGGRVGLVPSSLYSPLTPRLSKSRFCTGWPRGKTCSSSMMCTLEPRVTALCRRPSPGNTDRVQALKEPIAQDPPTTHGFPSFTQPCSATSTHQCPERGHRRCCAGQVLGAQPRAGSGLVAAAAASGCGPARPSKSGPLGSSALGLEAAGTS